MSSRIVLDTSEQQEYFKRELSDRRPLWHDDGVHRYDFEVHCQNGDVVKVERKDLKDLQGSMDDGKLGHQVGQADILVVELGPISWTNLAHRARRRLQHLQECCPVVTTTGPEDTLGYLRRLSERGLTAVRANRVKSTKYNTRWALLSTLYRINPEYEEEGGELRGDVLSEMVNWTDLVVALNLEAWRDLPHIGTTTITKITKSLIEGEEPR